MSSPVGPARPRRNARRPRGVAGTLGRSAAQGTARAGRGVVRGLVGASRAHGAGESGLSALIWNQVLSYGADAMIVVALAGSVFFGASAHAQRGNVLLYLAVTMAPFAVVAPVIGPVLDRWQHGRRTTLALTAAGRALLAVIMAAHSSELFVLYPCALGSLVLSKAYGVVRAAATPRLVPRGMTLAAANARLTIFGLGSTLVLGGLVGVVIRLSGSYPAGLLVTAAGFAACAFFALRLPRRIDTATSEQPTPSMPSAGTDRGIGERFAGWARRGFDAHLIAALQGESVLRLLSGLLTIYLAFYVETTAHGSSAALELGLVVAAAGIGNAAGTAIGTRLRNARAEQVIVGCAAVAGVVTLVVAAVFGVPTAALAVLAVAVTNAVSKISLDALIQRDVAESLRTAAFARSETFLQLAWVAGAAIGVALPSHRGDGGWALLIAGTLACAVATWCSLRLRATGRPARRVGAGPPPDAMVGFTPVPRETGAAPTTGSVGTRGRS